MLTNGTHDPKATSLAPIHAEILYISPRRQGAPRVQVPNKSRFIIPQPKIPAKVNIDGNVLDRISELRYADHDFHDFEKFPDFT